MPSPQILYHNLQQQQPYLHSQQLPSLHIQPRQLLHNLHKLKSNLQTNAQSTITIPQLTNSCNPSYILNNCPAFNYFTTNTNCNPTYNYSCISTELRIKSEYKNSCNPVNNSNSANIYHNCSWYQWSPDHNYIPTYSNYNPVNNNIKPCNSYNH